MTDLKSIRVVFNTWSGAFFNPGGGEVQLTNSKSALEKQGLQIFLYDQWNPLKQPTILHQFSMEEGVEHVIQSYKRQNIPVALSTIFWAKVSKEEPRFARIKYMLTMADVILTNSNEESAKLSENFNIDISKFYKTRNSITSDYLADGNKNLFCEKYNLDKEFILTVANIDRRKNTHKLVEACKKLNLQLVSIGAIRDDAYFSDFKDSYDNFIQLGPIFDVELIKSAYMNCSLFALPSLCETPGIAALEAASQGAKILITDQGPTYEYFGDHVEYVSPFNDAQLCEKIESIFRAPSASDVLKDKVRSEYTWDLTAMDIINGYKTVM